MRKWLWLVIAVLVAARLLYHATYLTEVPFAAVPLSDGAVYESMARDIVEHPPWGTRPFYLQGLYAYFLAVGLAVGPWLGAALVLQLVLAFATLALFLVAAVQAWGRAAGLCSTIVLLAYPALAFYENKYLSAELGIFANVLVLVAFGRAMKAPGWRSALGVGVAAGLSVLARPNMVVALPFVAWALHGSMKAQRRALASRYVAAALGLMLALAPMATRNWIVTGRPSLGPEHGGGTSYYIGNNPHARGVWNDAGGLLSGNVATESVELTRSLGLGSVPQSDRPRAIGRALYRRAGQFMRQEPGAWAWLQVRKMWLTVGNDELTQDYDWYGERELIPWTFAGLPFSVFLGLGITGGWLVARRGRVDACARTRRPWLVLLFGQVAAVAAANVVFFTSAQHRLPLAVPLAFAAGPLLLAGVERLRLFARCPSWVGPIGWKAIVLLMVLVAQGFWPRSRTSSPSAVHYYNLAIAHRSLGEHRAAMDSIDRAVALRPTQPLFLLERARLRLSAGDEEGVIADLGQIRRHGPHPAWVDTEVDGLLQALAKTRREQGSQ